MNKFSRREALGLLLSAPGFAAATAAGLKAAEDKPFMIIVSGIDPLTSPKRLSAALDRLLSRGLAVGCAIDVESSFWQSA